MNKLIYFTIVTIFFPIYLRFSGKDALTTGSIFILFTFGHFIANWLINRGDSKKFILLVVFFSLLGLFNTSVAPAELLGKSFRHFIAFFCSMLLFFTIANHLLGLEDSRRRYTIETLVNLIVIMVAIQIIIGTILYFYPPFGRLFSVFTTRDKDILETQVQVYKRLSSIVAGGEGFGEIIAALAPLVLYMVFKRGGKIFPTALFVLYTVGVILSATRSSILLFGLASMTFFVLNIKQIKLSKALFFSYIFLIALIIIIFCSPTIINKLSESWEVVATRFNVLGETYSKTDSLYTAINRRVWEYATSIVIQNLNLFGNGMVTPRNFHNLYLTLLYKFGVVGAGCFVIFFIYLLIKLVRGYRQAVDPVNKSLLSACLISFATLLINEIKFEFTRYSSYQQLIWMLFAIYWAASLIKKPAKQELKKITNRGILKRRWSPGVDSITYN